MSEIKSGPTALCDGEGLHFTVKRGGKSGGAGCGLEGGVGADEIEMRENCGGRRGG